MNAPVNPPYAFRGPFGRNTVEMAVSTRSAPIPGVPGPIENEIPITQLPLAGTLDGSEQIALVQNGITSRVNARAISLVGASVPVIAVYTIGVFVPGVLTANQFVLLHIFSQSATFPINFGYTQTGARSACASQVNATNNLMLTISKCPAASDPTNLSNFTSVGTITFFSGGHIGQLAASGASPPFEPGDVLAVIAPGVVDPALAGIMLTLVADLS